MKNKGFTLVEMLVAIGLFSAVSVIALSAFFSLTAASRHAQGTRALADATAFIFEDIVRTVHLGASYESNALDELTINLSEDIDGQSEESIKYTFNAVEGVVYKKNNGSLAVALNDPNRIFIETMEFDIFDENSVKKRIAIVLKGTFVGINNQNQPIFISTTIAQRI